MDWDSWLGEFKRDRCKKNNVDRKVSCYKCSKIKWMFVCILVIAKI